MEGAPLRSVDGLAPVEKRLPGLDPEAQRALALVSLAGRPRAEAAGELGVSEAELSRLLAAGRKALRRTIAPLPSGGWCERAERLISDRIDGALAPQSRARLDAHLRACERCATHERKLAEAHGLLLEARAPTSPPSLAVLLALAVLVIAVIAVTAGLHHP
jgi:hypothetical protein